MNDNFQHLLLSRFNVQITSDAPPCSDEWMNRRFDLFKRYSYKSIKYQSNCNFKWIIFLDVRTNEFWLNEFSQLDRNLYTLIFIDGVFSKEKVLKSIGRVCNKATRWLITTRMDMDDAVSDNFIDQIQSEFDMKNEIINITQGYELGANGEVRWKLHSHNAWASLVELNSIQPLTIWGAAHEDWKTTGIKTRQVWRNAKWLQILHSGAHMSGVTDKSFRGIRMPRQFILRKFNIDSEFSIANDSIIFWPWHVVVDVASILSRLFGDKTRRDRFIDLFFISR